MKSFSDEKLARAIAKLISQHGQGGVMPIEDLQAWNSEVLTDERLSRLAMQGYVFFPRPHLVGVLS